MSANNLTTLDPRFDEAEAEVDRGEPWRYRDPGAPNPLTIVVTGWSTGFTDLGEAEFLNGTDRNGKKWSLLVGCTVLRKRLIEGVEEQWDDERRAFVVTATLGRVRPGDVVSIMYLGDKQGQFRYPDFRVSRKPPPPSADPGRRQNGEEPPGAPSNSSEPPAVPATDEIPY